MLPFTHAQFMAVFGAYNEAVWPAPIAAYVVAAVVLAAIALRRDGAGPAAATALALLWAWTGIAYHGLHFSAVNPAARLFAGLFVVEAMVLLWWGWRRQPRLRFGRGPRPLVGAALLLYALVAYPGLGLLLGLRYPAMPTFGITPCPLTLFTFGVLMLSTARLPWWLLAIPVAWSLVGGSAAILLQVPQDWVLLFSGAVVAALNVRANPGLRAFPG